MTDPWIAECWPKGMVEEGNVCYGPTRGSVGDGGAEPAWLRQHPLAEFTRAGADPGLPSPRTQYLFHQTVICGTMSR